MLNVKAFANAATVVTVVFYIACALLSYIAPDIIFSFANSWVHTLNLEAVRMSVQINFGTLIYGLISISVLAWVTTYATIALYNKWAK